MRDEFAGQRLPDLPNAGYATRREKMLTDEIMMYVRGAERNRILLLSNVVGGREKFRRITMKAWRHLRVDVALVDAVFGYLVLLAGANPHEQLDSLQRMEAAKRSGLWIPSGN